MNARQRGARPPSVLVTISAVLQVLVVGTFLLTFVLQTYRIPSGSMIPTLEIGDCVLIVVYVNLVEHIGIEGKPSRALSGLDEATYR